MARHVPGNPKRKVSKKTSVPLPYTLGNRASRRAVIKSRGER